MSVYSVSPVSYFSIKVNPIHCIYVIILLVVHGWVFMVSRRWSTFISGFTELQQMHTTWSSFSLIPGTEISLYLPWIWTWFTGFIGRRAESSHTVDTFYLFKLWRSDILILDLFCWFVLQAHQKVSANVMCVNENVLKDICPVLSFRHDQTGVQTQSTADLHT